MRMAWMILVPLFLVNGCSSGDEDDGAFVVEADEDEDADAAAEEEGDGSEAPSGSDASDDNEGEGGEESEAAASPSPAEEPAAGGGSDFEAMLKSMGAPAQAAKPAPAATPAPETATATAAQAAQAEAEPKAVKPAKAAMTGKKSAPGGKVRKLKSAVLAVREGPSLNAKIVGYIHGDAKVKVVAEGPSGWTQIGPKRFVRSKYLTTGAPKTVGAGQEIYVVKSEALYIRNAPDLNATVVGVLTTGDKVRAAPAANGWVQISPNRFVRAKYLEYVGH